MCSEDISKWQSFKPRITDRVGSMLLTGEKLFFDKPPKVKKGERYLFVKLGKRPSFYKRFLLKLLLNITIWREE